MDEHLLTIRGVSKSFVQHDRSVEVLADVNLTVHNRRIRRDRRLIRFGKVDAGLAIAGLQLLTRSR